MPRFFWLLLLMVGGCAVAFPVAATETRVGHGACPEFPRELLPRDASRWVVLPWQAVPTPQEPNFSAAPRRELPPLPPDEFALLPLPIAGSSPSPTTGVEPDAFPFDEDSPPAVPEAFQQGEVPLLIPVPLPPEADWMLDRLAPSAPQPKPIAPPESPSLPPELPKQDELFDPGPGPTATPGLPFAPEPVWNPRHPALSQALPTEDQFVELPGEFRPFPDPANLTAESPAAGWESLYQSAERRPVRTARLGCGPLRVLAVASLSGDEPAAGELLNAWLAANLVPAESTLLLVQNPNPDGLQRRQSANAAGVELNRNFPTRDFVADPTAEAGPYPGSEVETGTLLRLLADFRPHRVIYLRPSPGRERRLLANAPALAVAQTAIEGAPFQLDPLTDPPPGSLENFVSRDLRLELIVVDWPRQENPVDFWRANAGVFKKLAAPAAPKSSAPNPAAPKSSPSQPAGPVASPFAEGGRG